MYTVIRDHIIITHVESCLDLANESDERTWSVLLIAANGMHEIYQFSDSSRHRKKLLHNDELIFCFSDTSCLMEKWRHFSDERKYIISELVQEFAITAYLYFITEA